MSALTGVEARSGFMRRAGARVWAALLAAWGAATGVLPHVLHHVGPLAGAAFLAGTAGRFLFAAIALALSVPFLLRIHRRFTSWVAPAIGLAAMAAAFALSTLLVAPLITGEGSGSTPQPAGHLGHHHK